MGYEGVTLDFLYVFICWELDIADLKQLVLNSIKYSSVTEKEKEDLNTFFDYKWNRFLDYVLAKYWTKWTIIKFNNLNQIKNAYKA